MIRARSTRSLLALSGAVALVAAACGSGGDAGLESASTPGASTDTETAQVVEAALVPTARGEDLDFNSLQGQDVLLWFWAPW